MAEKIQIRRDTASMWESVNPTLAQGELAYEIDTDKFKVGNGTSNYKDLPYASKGDKGDAGLKGDKGADGADGKDGIDAHSGHITILPYNYDEIIQGNYTFSLSTDHFLNAVFYNITSEINDGLSYKVNLSTGTYTLRFMGAITPNYGILNIYIEEKKIASFDLYSSKIVRNVIFSQTDIEIANSGIKDLILKVEDKNPASSGYRFSLQIISLWRTF